MKERGRERREEGGRERYLSASAKLWAPEGIRKNSWKASALPAWTPPLITFRQGTGRHILTSPPPTAVRARPLMWRHNGTPRASAPARQHAMERARTAFAPIRALSLPGLFSLGFDR